MTARRRRRRLRTAYVLRLNACSTSKFYPFSSCLGSWSIFAVSIILFARLRAAVTSAVTSRDRPRSPDELRKKESAVTTNLSDTVMHDLHRGLIE